MKKPIRLLLVDDHPFFSQGIANALKFHEQFKVVATVADGALVMASVLEHEPDIILMDINLPNKNGLELSVEIKRKCPTVKIIIVTMYMPSDIKIEPEKESIDGFLLKNSGTELLLEALEKVTNGERFFDSNIKSSNNHSKDNFTQKFKLSTREKEILELIVAGKNNKEIAAALYLSELTIKTHRKNIMSKLDVHNLADLIRKSGL